MSPNKMIIFDIFRHCFGNMIILRPDGIAKHHSYKSEDGTAVDQQGDFKQKDEGNSIESVKGSYSYTDDEGHQFSVTYTADENGYRPVSTIII